MQSPEEYLRERAGSSLAPPSSPASQIAVFVASFVVVCIGVYLARTPWTSGDDQTVVTDNDGTGDFNISNDELVKSMESLVNSGDQSIISGLKAIAAFTDPASGLNRLPNLLSNLEIFTKTMDSYSKSLLAVQNLHVSLDSVQAQASAIQKVYSEKKANLERAAPQLLSDLYDLKQKEQSLHKVATDLDVNERRKDEIGSDVQRSQGVITELERSVESTYSSWRSHVDQKMKTLKHSMEYSEDALARRMQEAKSSSGRVRVLRRELQTHSVILTESATKIASLSHQKTILESRFKSIEQVGQDLTHGSTDRSLENAIQKQKQRVATVKSEYSSLPDEEPAKATQSDSDEVSANLPGYKKKMMQIAVDEAERKFAWLQELQTIATKHGEHDEVQEEALRSFVNLKKSKLSKELNAVESEIDSERKWQERIVSELNQKNEQLKVLEHDLSSDTISGLRTQAERAKAAYHDADAEAESLQQIYQKASVKFQNAQSESGALHEKLEEEKERVRQLSESKGSLIRAADLLQRRVDAAVRANRSTMVEIWRIRGRVHQLQSTFDSLMVQYTDADKQLRMDASQIRAQLATVCQVLE